VLIVRSPVRISFAGGGTDLPAFYEQFGGSVLSTAINKYFYTILGKRSDGRIQVISSDLRIFETWRDIATMDERGSGLEIPLAVMKDLGRDMSVDLFLASEIPPGTGLGSSASVCVNILKTLATYLQIPLSKYDLAERAFRIAREGLQRHVGKQDVYAAAYGGLNRIVFHRDGGTEVALSRSPLTSPMCSKTACCFFTGSAHHSWTILKQENPHERWGAAAKALKEPSFVARCMMR
jgi:D-glycero-alpha-D-manno-heptose-7-phosphate kinase